MARTVRQDTVTFYSSEPISGLFVVGKPNNGDPRIPPLPALCLEESQRSADSVFVSTEKQRAGPNIIYCEDLHTNFAVGDIVSLDSRSSRVRTVLSAKSTANTLLVTERCENRCIFCSQPPNEWPDTELYIRAALALLNFDSRDYVGISGGEPTYNDRAFIRLLRVLNHYGVNTPLHILTNGRKFSKRSFVVEVEKLVRGREVLWGVPLYGHRASLHDHLVDAPGAFVETMQGLLNLGDTGQIVELRIIPTQQNLKHLADIVTFVVSQLPSVGIISIMNLEPKGWARKNFDNLYVPVAKQNSFLTAAVKIADFARRDVRLFNYPLCLLDQPLHKYSYKTISDWKNYYPQECTECRLFDDCGGFFASATGRFIEKLEVQT